MDFDAIYDMVTRGNSMGAAILRERALSMLAGNCDGAYKRDNAGFNRMDSRSDFVQSLVSWVGRSTKREGLRFTPAQDLHVRKILAKYVQNQIAPAFESLVVEMDVEDWPEALVAHFASCGIAARGRGDAVHAATCFDQAAALVVRYNISRDRKVEIWNQASREHAAIVADAQRQAESERTLDSDYYIEMARDTPTDSRELAAIALYEEQLSAMLA
jgi:hypothetical protein